MIKELPSDIEEVIKDQKIKVVNNKSDIDPYDVHFTEYPSDEIAANKELLKLYNQEINDKTPKWLNIYFTVKNHDKKDDEIKLNIRFLEVVYGDTFLQENQMKSFPAMLGGAVYMPERGTWKVFEKGEATKTIESRVTSDLVAWGVYKSSTVTLARIYIERSMLDESFGKLIPFTKSKPYLIAFKNGTYNMLTNKIEEHSANNFILNYHNYCVDPKKNNAPATNHLLKKMFGTGAIVVKQFIGYMFYRDYTIFNKALFIHGSGGEGKSTLIRHIQYNLIGEENFSSVPPDDLDGKESRFNKVLLYGKETNIVADIEKGYISNTAVLKKLTGGDSINAEFKGMNGFMFQSYAKMLFSANEMPSFSDTSNGFQDRLLTVDTINGDTRTENSEFWNDVDMDRVKFEAPAFAMECMQIFNEARKERKMIIPDSVQESTQRWIDSNDKFGIFVDERLTIIPNKTRGVKVADVRTAWEEFAKENGYSDKLSTATMEQKFKKYDVVKKKSRKGLHQYDQDNTWRFLGIAIQ